jgi:asparagine synthetase B (glutamine-hydrolysing)
MAFPFSLLRVTGTVDHRTPIVFSPLPSGGLDSSLIAAIASRLHQDMVKDPDASNKLWFPRMHSFSIGLEGTLGHVAWSRALVFALFSQ